MKRCIKKYNILFMGTPEFAVPSFNKVLNFKRFNIKGVITQPDKKIGRERKMLSSPIKKIAQKNNIKVYQPTYLNDKNFIKDLRKLDIDVILVVAYGKIIPKIILDIPKFGSINVHPSLLPKYRGPSPMQSALLNRDKNTGITIMLMNEKMDEGDILMQKIFIINDNENISDIHDRLAKESGTLINCVILDYINGNIKPIKQDNNIASYCKMIKKSDGKIDWSLSDRQIINKYRALHPWPGVFSYLCKENIKTIIKLLDIKKSKEKNSYEPGTLYKNNQILLVATGDGNSIILNKVQIEGKKPITGKEFISGYNRHLETKLL